MFGRIFGRGKDDQEQAVCADCGRTLLAGEWTQTVVGDDGEELLICSLCGQAHARGGGDALTGGAMPANSGRVHQSRSDMAPQEQPPAAAEPAPRDQRAESDAFWQALKEKDAEIERLQAQLSRAEAERQELAGRFARLGSATPEARGPQHDAFAPAAAPEVEPPSALTGDSSEPGERTWGETPAEFAAEMAALRETEAAAAGIAAAPEVAPAPAAPAAPAFIEPAAPIYEPPAVLAETPVEPAYEPAFATEPAAAAPAYPAAAEPAPGPAPVAQTPASVFEDTQPIPEVDEEPPAEDAASTGGITGPEVAAAVAAAAAAAAPAEVGSVAPQAPASAVAPAGPSEAAVPAAPAEAAVPAAAADAQAAAASLTLLQRGVDLLNVSRVPRKIAETNEQLGLPHVHVGFDGSIVAITFLWTMGWYRFQVDIDSGDVSMSDRGYEERADLRPNASVRADGTVQLAPAQISRAAAQRTNSAPASAPAPAPAPATPSAEGERPAEEPPAAAPPPAAPETPRVAAQKPPEILSKSLLGQRSDDETASWEQTKARDFDWDR